MRKKIIISESQLRSIIESDGQYINPENNKPEYNGWSDTTAEGGLDSEDDIMPMTTDDLANDMTNQRIAHYGCTRQGVVPKIPKDGIVDEDVNFNNNSMTNDNDNSFLDSGLDALSNNDKDDDSIVINNTIQSHIELLINDMKSLPAKKKAMVINKMIENADLESIPQAWKRDLVLKIWNDNYDKGK